MISIIICSANSELLETAISNIKSTIGVVHELLVFENSDGEKGICEIYNEGANRARYEILCYMHEDLNIKTQNWGKEVIRIFNEQKSAGIIGVAGSSYKSYTPSGWAVAAHGLNMIFCNYIQVYKRNSRPSFHYHLNPGENDLAPVVCVDGMWFCTRKTIVTRYPFDQDLLKGFHCYDLDFCFSVKQEYDIFVTYNILMEHFSEGGYDRSWIDDTLKIHSKWSDMLPLSLNHISVGERNFIKKRSYRWLIEKMISLQYSLKSIVGLLNQHRKYGSMKNKEYLKLLYYTVKTFFYNKDNLYRLIRDSF